MSVSSIAKQQSAIGAQSNHIKLGIVGTANVGKSSLFNAITGRTERCSPSENCLFRTVDPYIASFTPRDPIIEYIAGVLGVAAVPASLSIVDTAGLVEGSFREGKGVGPSTLSSLQPVDLMLHLVREFEDVNITHYSGSVDPLRDIEVVNNELMQFDLDIIEEAITEMENIKLRDQGGEYLTYQITTLIKAWSHLAGSPRPERGPVLKKSAGLKRLRPPLKLAGTALRYGSWDFSERNLLAEYRLLTTKKMLFLVNMSSRDYLRQQWSTHPTVVAVQQAVELYSGGESSVLMTVGRGDSTMYTQGLQASATGATVGDTAGEEVSLGGSSHRGAENAEVFPVSLQLEESIREIFRVEGAAGVQEYFAANPSHSSAVPMIIAEAHRALGLIHFYTTSEREVKCWCLKQGKNILESSAVVDVNISRNFLRGEVIAFSDYEMWRGDRLKLMIEGKLKTETKKYIVNNGDIIQYFTQNRGGGT